MRITLGDSAAQVEARLRPVPFAPLQLPDFGLHLYLQEAPDGRAVHLSAGLTPLLGKDPEPEAIVGVEHDLEWVAGAPAMTSLA